MWLCRDCYEHFWRYFGTCPKCSAKGSLGMQKQWQDPYIFFSPGIGGMQQWPGNVPSRITGIRANEELDLGLALLLEAQA